MKDRIDEVYHLLVNEFGAKCEICWGESAVWVKPMDFDQHQWIVIHEESDSPQVRLDSPDVDIVEFVKASLCEFPFFYPC